MTNENVTRLIEKLEKVAVNFWLMKMSADARSIEQLLDDVSPESRDRIAVELARVRGLKSR
jgi:hypothetical protein